MLRKTSQRACLTFLRVDVTLRTDGMSAHHMAERGLFTKRDLSAGKAAGVTTYSCTSSPDNAASGQSGRAQRVRDFTARIGGLLKTACPS